MQINESRLKAHSQRIETVDGLSDGFLKCFDGDDIAVKVKNLSFDDLQKATEEVSIAETLKNKSLNEISGIDSNNVALKAVVSIFEILKESYDNLSTETVRRISILKYGCVEPKIDHTTAVLIAKNFAFDFKRITDRILILTQMGAIPLGESEKSTKDTADG